MVLAAEELTSLDTTRLNEAYITSELYGRVEHMSTWKKAISDAYDLYRGKVSFTRPDGSTVTTLRTQNTAHDGAKDLKNLVEESLATLYCDPIGAGREPEERSKFRQAIGRGYWESDYSEGRVGKLAFDLVIAGACFLLSYADRGKSQYPMHERLKPMGVYPTFFEDQLLDLLYVRDLKTREAALLYPNAGIPYDKTDSSGCKVIDFFTPDETWKCIHIPGEGGGRTIRVDYQRNPIGRVPVAWAMDDSADDAFEGMFDQLAAILQSRSQAFGAILDHSDRATYFGVESKGVKDGTYGPMGEILLDENVADARYRPIAPPPLDQALPYLVSALDHEGRGTLAYPAARQGEATQSIISAAGVQAFQGERSSLVRSVQRKIGQLRVRQTENDFRLDREVLNFRKPLIFAVGRKKDYSPSADIGTDYRVRVVYGGAGLDTLNQSTLAVTKASNQIISYAEARAQDPTILNPEDTERRIETEQARKLVFQKMEAQADVVTSLRFYDMLSDGKSAPEAIKELLKTPEQIAQQPAPGQPGPEAQAPTAPEQALAVGKGAAAPQGPAAPFPSLGPEFAPPPLNQVIVRQ